MSSKKKARGRKPTQPRAWSPGNRELAGCHDFFKYKQQI